MSLVVCVVSRTKGRGKTALIERLTKSFTNEGFGVATVKHISDSFDTAKKDTWRHLEAGAVITVAATSDEIATITRIKNPPLERVLEAVYIKQEMVIAEGYKRSSYPKILCADTAEEAEAAVKEIPNIIMVTGLISSNAEEKERFESKSPKTPVYNFVEVISALKKMLADSILKGLPGLDCKECGYDSCQDFAKAIIRGEAAMKDCEVLTTEIATLRVDGKNIPLGRFPQHIIKSITLGILDTLKGVSKSPRRVEIIVRADEERKRSLNQSST